MTIYEVLRLPNLLTGYHTTLSGVHDCAKGKQKLGQLFSYLFLCPGLVKAIQT